MRMEHANLRISQQILPNSVLGPLISSLATKYPDAADWISTRQMGTVWSQGDFAEDKAAFEEQKAKDIAEMRMLIRFNGGDRNNHLTIRYLWDRCVTEPI